MLQILGWLGCVMLAVKLVEMGHNPTFRDEEGKLKETVVGLFLLGWAAVIGFTIWFWVQGQEVREYQTSFEPTYASELERVEEEMECFAAAGDDSQAAAECLNLP